MQDSLQRSLGQDIAVEPSSAYLSRIAGASEKDIVHSGLAQTMERAAKDIIRTAHRHQLGLDLRTAAYVTAIEKICRIYHIHGFTFS